MKFPIIVSQITGKKYNGSYDDEGRPHGYGTMEYSVQNEKKYKYKGHFEHGERSGYGVWYERTLYIREYEPWEWAQMGEYDSAGRLIHPNTKTGPRREIIYSWDMKFRGWWQNDDAVHDIKHKKYTELNSDIPELKENINLFLGTKEIKSDPQTAIAEAERQTSVANASILWAEQLGCFYEITGELEKAIKAYEKCIINGHYTPIYFLANMYLKDGDEEYYETLMEAGRQLGVPNCLEE